MRTNEMCQRLTTRFLADKLLSSAMEALISLFRLEALIFVELIATDLQARQAWDFKKWMYQVARLDLSICEISCLQLSHEKFTYKNRLQPRTIFLFFLHR